jgi:hypothetical protein
MRPIKSTYGSSVRYEEVSKNEHEAGSHCGSLAGFRRVLSWARVVWRFVRL